MWTCGYLVSLTIRRSIKFLDILSWSLEMLITQNWLQISLLEQVCLAAPISRPCSQDADPVRVLQIVRGLCFVDHIHILHKASKSASIWALDFKRYSSRAQKKHTQSYSWCPQVCKKTTFTHLWFKCKSCDWIFPHSHHWQKLRQAHQNWHP